MPCCAAAGFSVGEITALIAAGCLTPEQGGWGKTRQVEKTRLMNTVELIIRRVENGNLVMRNTRWVEQGGLRLKYIEENRGDKVREKTRKIR